MKRWLLILIIVGVIGVLAGGVAWYLHRNSAEKLMARSELALYAGQYERALELAKDAVAKAPDNWRGHYILGQACLSLTRYDDARKALADAAQRNPEGVAVELAIANTYAAPGRRALASEEAARQTKVVTDAIAQIRQANAYLAAVKAPTPATVLDIRQAIGGNLMLIGMAERDLGRRLDQEAQIATSANDKAGHDAKQKASAAATADSEITLREATDIFMDICKQDPKRAVAATTLVELCTLRRDEASLKEAQRLIFGQDSPPIEAAVRLISEDLRTADLPGNERDRAARLAQAATQLDALLQKTPGDLDATLTRAEVALRQNDLAMVERLAAQVLDPKATPSRVQKAHARLLHAQWLLSQGKVADAERELYALKTEEPQSIPAHYLYGLVAAQAGKTELAREAMRSIVTRIDPKNAEALKFLARSLVNEFPQQAFPDAKACYEAHPDDREAVYLYAQAAWKTNQQLLAQKALETALRDFPNRPDMLMAVYRAYLVIGDKSAAEDAARRAAQIKPGNDMDRAYVVESLEVLKRLSEAEKLLADERAARPNDARPCWALGDFYTRTGRRMQGIEQYREAVRLAPQNLAYREVLATALYEYGLLDECLAQAKAILEKAPSHAQAAHLVAMIRESKGEISTDELLETLGGGRQESLAAARQCLRRGQPQECVNLCLKELKAAPEKRDARLLLAQAYLTQGLADKGIEELKTLIKQAPDQLPAYQQLAAILATTKKPEEVEQSFNTVPGARREMVSLAMGGLYESRLLFDAAAESYGRVLALKDADEDNRDRARLFRAQALANGKHIDQALVELEPLAARPAWQTNARLLRASLLATAGRTQEAEKDLSDLLAQAVKNKNPDVLQAVAAFYTSMRQADKALAVCDRLQALEPKEIRPLLLRAEALAAANRQAEVPDCLRKAVELAPGNLELRVRLARTLDVQEKPTEALDALKQMEALGDSGRTLALMERGMMFGRWGLQAQAVEQFEQLAKAGLADDTWLQLLLGQAFSRLGQKDRAREVLGRIPEYAPQYVEARLVMADLEDKDDARLRLLRDVRRKKPDDLNLLATEMVVLMRIDRPAEAAKTFQEFTAKRAAGQALPDKLAYLGSQAMLAAKDPSGAADFSNRMARESQHPRWRQTAALLSMDTKPDVAKALLPQPAAAFFNETLMGLILAVQTGADPAPWKTRLDQMQQSLAKETPPRSLPINHRLLASIACGAKAEAAAILAKESDVGLVSRRVAEELVASMGTNPKSAAEAAQLLKATLAIDLGLSVPAQTWSMQALKARPECLWAAAIALESKPDATQLKEILKPLQSGNDVMSRTVQARQAMNEKQFDKAIEIWRQAAAAEKDNPEVLLNLGLALEQAGRLADALPIYRRVWEATQNPIAANNAAYLTSQLHPKDTAKLAEAQKWMEAATKVAPDTAAFRDTLGWLACLQGRHDEALLQLGRAIKGLPDSPEAHYHLACAQAAVGRTDLARWHYAAAVALAEKLKAAGGESAVSAQEAGRLAKEALARLDPKKS